MAPRWRSSNSCKLGEMDRCIAFQIAYDGTDFAGSQLQPGVRTVQGELEQSWWRLHAEHVRVTLAGRTDAGVHASGQVGNVTTTSERSLETILRAMNALLPPDVSIPQIWEPPRDFHARFWAEHRTYEYVLDDAPVASPFLRRTALAVSRTLDVEAMHEASQVLVGTHDYAAFTLGVPVGPTVRSCVSVECQRRLIGGHSVAVVRITASGFLRNMVRIVVGTLLLVGVGSLTTEGLKAILDGRNRQKAGNLAPAHGLTLVSVTYPRSALRPLE